MTPPALDTSPDAARVQIELLQKASAARHFRLVRSMSQTVIGLSRRAIRRARPELTEREVALEFVRLSYGAALANDLRRYLGARDDGESV